MQEKYSMLNDELRIAIEDIRHINEEGYNLDGKINKENPMQKNSIIDIAIMSLMYISGIFFVIACILVM